MHREATATFRGRGSQKRSAQIAEATFQRLQAAVLSGELKEGERVREQRLAREWQVGRTPMREAVRRAAEFGYLLLKPNHAPIVRKLSSQDVRQIYGMREVLECFALQSSWTSFRSTDFQRLRAVTIRVEKASTAEDRLRAQFTLDRRLHHLWISHGNNPWLVSCLERLLIYRPNQLKILSSYREMAEAAFEDHRRILNALEEMNKEQAVILLANHIRNSGEILAGLIERSLYNP